MGDPSLGVIYSAMLLLGIAYGVSIAVLAIHLERHHIPKLAMGGLAAAFATGIVVFSMVSGWLVGRFGAKRTLVTALLGYALCVTAFPFLTDTTALSVARFFDGAFSVAIWVAAETALLSRSNRANKALVMSLYAMSLGIGYVVGPILATGVVRVASTKGTFLAAGLLALVASAVVAVCFDKKGEGDEDEARGKHEASTGRNAPSVGNRALPWSELLWRTKTSCLATFSYGYFQASVVLFLPLFLIEKKNVPEERTLLVTAFFALGMLLSSVFVGRLGDRYGHLLVMRGLGGIGAAMVAGFVVLPTFSAMCLAVFFAGCTLASISPVSLALQGVLVEKHDLGRANALYNASYAIGMLLGPVVSSVLFTRFGGGEMLLHLAALWGFFVAFTTVFAGDDPHRSTDRTASAEAEAS
jgi:MFS family permease